MSNKIRVMLSNRHVHLMSEDVERLFGPGHQLTPKNKRESSEFPAEETVTLVGPKGKIAGVRVMGPARRYTQVELLKGDSIKIGVNAPIVDSGNLENAAPLKIIGTAGEIVVEKCSIIALRHIHFKPETAAELNIKDRDFVCVKVEGERGLIFNHVLARVASGNIDVMHLDIEEGNAANLKNDDFLEVLI